MTFGQVEWPMGLTPIEQRKMPNFLLYHMRVQLCWRHHVAAHGIQLKAIHGSTSICSQQRATDIDASHG